MVAKHHLARCGGEVLAHAKGVAVGQRHHEIALIGLEIAHEVLQTVDQALAIGLKCLLQRVRVGGEKVGRAEHVDDLPGEVVEPLLFARLQPLD